jgi:hypothetical protein
MISRIILFFGILMFPFATSHSALAETRNLAWDAVTQYSDGSPIETGKTVSYTVFWTNDPWLAPETLRTLVPSTTATTISFDPAVQGMTAYQTIYFTLKSVLSTGEESSLSAELPWSPLPVAVSGEPSAPAGLGITRIATYTSGGTWQIFWNPVTTYVNGTSIQGKTVRYEIFWTTDAGLSATTLTQLASSTTETALTFDPATSGMTAGQRVYFTAKAMLETGEESPFAGSLSWKVSNNGPGTPSNGRIVKKPRK